MTIEEQLAHIEAERLIYPKGLPHWIDVEVERIARECPAIDRELLIAIFRYAQGDWPTVREMYLDVYRRGQRIRLEQRAAQEEKACRRES